MIDLDVEFEPGVLQESKIDLSATCRSFNSRNKAKIEPFTLDIRDVTDYIPVHKTTILYWVNKGVFPKPIIKKGRGHKTRWRGSDVLAFIDAAIKKTEKNND